MLEGNRVAIHVEPEDVGRAARRVDHAHEELDGGRLAGAVGAEVAEDLALVHREVQVEDASAAAIVLREALGLDRARHRVLPFRDSAASALRRSSTFAMSSVIASSLRRTA